MRERGHRHNKRDRQQNGVCAPLFTKRYIDGRGNVAHLQAACGNTLYLRHRLLQSMNINAGLQRQNNAPKQLRTMPDRQNAARKITLRGAPIHFVQKHRQFC